MKVRVRRLRFLERILLHHGRWENYRMAYFFVYYGWKNVTVSLILFYFMFDSAFSAYPLYSEAFLAIYNVIFGMILVSYYAIFDQDVNDDLTPSVYHHLPTLYLEFKKSNLFSLRRYLLWTVTALLISLLFYFAIRFSITLEAFDASGRPMDMTIYSGLASLPLGVCTLFLIILDIKSYTAATLIFAILILSFLPALLFYFIENFITLAGYGNFGFMTEGSSLRFWALAFLLSALVLSSKYLYNAIKWQYSDSHLTKLISFLQRRSNSRGVTPEEQTAEQL